MDCRASETVSEIAELRRYFEGLASAKVAARPRGRWRKFAGLRELRFAPDWNEACWSAIVLRVWRVAQTSYNECGEKAQNKMCTIEERMVKT